MDLNGDIIIADYDNRWVSIFSPEGKFKVSIWGSRRDLQDGVSGELLVVPIRSEMPSGQPALCFCPVVGLSSG